MRIICVHGINEIAPDAESLDIHLFGKDNPNTSIVFWGDLSVYHKAQAKDLTIFEKLLCEILKIGTVIHLLQDVDNYFYDDAMRKELLQRFHNVTSPEALHSIDGYLTCPEIRDNILNSIGLLS